MEKNHLKHFDLDIYQEVLDNGLLVNVIPKKGNNVYVTFVTKYGSFDNEFIPYGKKKYYQAPMGVAHFLEHKVFEQKDGEDPFAFYTKNGADANAGTSYVRTSYLFSGPGHVEENVEYLLDFVQNPYFTEENVEKEKGIIEQEIKMYADIPYWKLYEKALFNTFHKHPLRYPIAGTVESIRQITKEDLYTCYDTFYHPSNMFLTIVGDVNVKKVIKTVVQNQAKKKYQKRDTISVKKEKEEDSVWKKEEIVTADVEIPKAAITYKFRIPKMDKNCFKTYLNIFFDLRLGSTSLLREQLKNENVITGGIGIDVMEAGEHMVVMASVDSKKPEYVLSKIQEEVQKKEITEEEFLREKKTMKSSCVYQSDSVYSVCEHTNSQILRFGKVLYDEYAWIDSLTMKECQKAIDSLCFENHTTTIVQKESIEKC